MYTIFITQNALNDISNAIDYWNNKQPYLGYDFVDEVKESHASIALMPTAFTKRYDDVRGKLVKRFPYLVLYQISDNNETVEILRIFNTY